LQRSPLNSKAIPTSSYAGYCISIVDVHKSMYEGDLPWSIRHSLTLVAVTERGVCIEPILFIDDPSAGRITMEPRTTLTGVIDLQKRFRRLDIAVMKSAVHLFWAYNMPPELGGPQWSGGWILIPKQKRK